MLDYRLRVFSRVAQEQSISRAARGLHISQPAVTQHIKLLEENFRTALFLRSSSGVTLTPAGVLLQEHARKVAAMDEAITRRLSAQGGSVSGRLRLGASTTVTQYFLPGVLVGFKARFPEVKIDVAEDNSDGVIGGVLARRVELGLIEAPCRRRDLRVTPFFDDEIIIIAAPGHPLARGRAVRAITARALAREPVVFRETGSGTRLAVELALRRHGVAPRGLRIVQELPSTEAIKRMVAGGAGLGFVSRISAASELAAGTLVEIRARGLRIRRAFSAILPQAPDPVGLRQLLLGAVLEHGRTAEKSSSPL